VPSRDFNGCSSAHSCNCMVRICTNSGTLIYLAPCPVEERRQSGLMMKTQSVRNLARSQSSSILDEFSGKAVDSKSNAHACKSYYSVQCYRQTTKSKVHTKMTLQYVFECERPGCSYRTSAPTINGLGVIVAAHLGAHGK
jgi:hypothetical protein